MPIIKNYDYLLVYLQEIGFYQSGGMGIVPISFTEIKAYLDLMGIRLSSFEVSTLRKMSVAYVSQHHDNYIDTEAPFNNCITVDELDRLMSNADKNRKKVL